MLEPTSLKYAESSCSYASEQPVICDKPNDSDILCGKDKTYAKHQGNQVYNDLIDSYVEQYRAAANKQAKMKITKEIVSCMETKYNSRFLKQGADGKWQEITHQNARDKVSHALRFAANNSSQANTLKDNMIDNSNSAPAAILKSSRSKRSSRKRTDSEESSSSESSHGSSTAASSVSTTVAASKRKHDTNLADVEAANLSFSPFSDHCNRSSFLLDEEPASKETLLFQRQQQILRQLKNDSDYDMMLEPEQSKASALSRNIGAAAPSTAAAASKDYSAVALASTSADDMLFMEPMIASSMSSAYPADMMVSMGHGLLSSSSLQHNIPTHGGTRSNSNAFMSTSTLDAAASSLFGSLSLQSSDLNELLNDPLIMDYSESTSKMDQTRL